MIFKYINYLLIITWVVKFNMTGLPFADTWYKFIPTADILKQLSNVTIIQPDKLLTPCPYENLLTNIQDFTEHDLNHMFAEPLDNGNIKAGGEYQPSTCNTQFSVAIIVPYRNREEQLEKFLKYFHYFLQKQYLHYRIYIVDQIDNNLFNRGLLLNIGAIQAMEDKFPCLILTDVDLIPLNLANLYVCTHYPRHMSTLINVFRYQLLYGSQFGGASAILSDQFKSVNGLSNQFDGWGGEDDDFSARIKRQNYEICRYDPEVSKYVMLKHKKQTKSESRNHLLREGHKRYNKDGINSVKSKTTVTLKDTYTHITVEN